ncbi:MAG TPA: PhoU domain-containing protein [Thermoplasmata archaeon]|nr:PhoU domain-containing protein [Thermoplasmata archaeon]
MTTRPDRSAPRPSAGASPGRGRRGASSRSATPVLVATIVVGRGEPPEHLFRRLLGVYLGGAREFVVRERPTVRSDTREVIRSFCRRTRQPEIVSEEGGVVRLRDIAFENRVPLPQRIARMGRLVVDFHREAVDSWARLPFGEDSFWERRDDEIDREAWYIQRLAALGPDGDGVALLGPFSIARSLERIADHAVALGETGRRLVDLPQSAGPLTSLKQFHRQAMEHLEGVLATPDGNVANELLDMGEALLASGRALADRLLPAVEGGTMPPATAAAIGRILESIGRTIAYAQDIAQVVLDRSLPLAAPEPRGAARSVAAPLAA